MTNHVNKGKQKSSVGQFGRTDESAHGKSKKMEKHHQLRQSIEHDQQ